MPRKDPLTQDEHASLIASLAHEGQFRRDGKTPYITHPQEVANRMKGPQLKAVAWLHDVWEDTMGEELVYDKEYLLSLNVSPTVVEAVEALTHWPQEPNVEYWGRVKRNKLALQVKITDIIVNLNDLNTTTSDKHLQVPRDRQIIKYAKALLFFKAPNLLGLDPGAGGTEFGT